MKTVTRYLASIKIAGYIVGVIAVLAGVAATPQARPIERTIAPGLVGALAPTPAPTPAPTLAPVAAVPAVDSSPVPLTGGGSAPQVPAGSLPAPTNLPPGAALVTVPGQGQQAVDPAPLSSGPKSCCSTAGGQPVIVPNDLTATISSSGNHGVSDGRPLGYNGQAVTLTANVYGGWSGVAPTYRWSNGATSQSISVTAPGSFTVTVTETNAGGVITATSNTVAVVFQTAPTPPAAAAPPPPPASTPTPR